MNALDVIFYADRTMRRAIDALEPEDWSIVIAGTWTSLDVLGHVSVVHDRTAAAIAATAAGAPLEGDPLEADEDDFNLAQAALRHGRPLDQFRAEYDAAHASLRAAAESVPSDLWAQPGTIPWYGPEYSLDDLVVYRIYGHVREHATHLGMALDIGAAARAAAASEPAEEPEAGGAP